MSVPGNGPRSILVVDDEPHLVRAVRMYLELEGYTVFGAQSGEEALEAVRDWLPDLVVLDVMLPGLNGFETLQEMRRVSNVPVIILTSLAHEEQRGQGRTLRGDEHPAKPV